MTMTPWTTGRPPKAGWWNASSEFNPEARRYWDGQRWSAPCYVGDSDEIAERARNTRSETPVRSIQWRGLTEPRS